MSADPALTSPRSRLYPLGVHYDTDSFGRFSEAIARFMGTGRFLAVQTVIVAVWVLVNATAATLRWDPYPFVLLNLGFSVQAAYAAPLILLAQTRQDDRDRAQFDRDRELAARTQADAEYVARELVAIRLTLSRLEHRAADELRGHVMRLDRGESIIEQTTTSGKEGA